MSRYNQPDYPDNIRSFDHDPRSPFYRDYRSEAEESLLEALGKKYPKFFAKCDELGIELGIEEPDEDAPLDDQWIGLKGHRGFVVGDVPHILQDFLALDRADPALADKIEEILP